MESFPAGSFTYKIYCYNNRIGCIHRRKKYIANIYLWLFFVVVFFYANVNIFRVTNEFQSIQFKIIIFIFHFIIYLFYCNLTESLTKTIYLFANACGRVAVGTWNLLFLKDIFHVGCIYLCYYSVTLPVIHDSKNCAIEISKRAKS